MHFLCICSNLSVVVSLLWVCFSSRRLVSGFQHLCSGIFAHLCCCRCRHPRFIVDVLELARVAAGMKHDRTCLFTLMWESCTKVFVSITVRMFFIFLCCCRTFFFLVYFSFDQVRALFLQSLPSQLVAAAAAATSTTREPQVQGVDVQPS